VQGDGSRCTVPIRTGRRATIRLARISRGPVAISKAGVEFTNGKRPGAVGALAILNARRAGAGGSCAE